MDDSLVSVNPDHLDTLLDSINSFHPAIQFTSERDIPLPGGEAVNYINFLDMSIFRNLINNEITTCWYKKPYSSGRLLNYQSCHSRDTIKGVAINAIRNIIGLSSAKYRTDNIRTIYEILGINGYPSHFTTRLLSRTLCEWDSKVARAAEGHYATITYSKHIFEKLKQIFDEFMPGIKICGKPANSNFFSHFSRIKDKEPVGSRLNCVVLIPCDKCKGLWVGNTQYDQNVSELLDSVRDPVRSCGCSHILDKEKCKITQCNSHTKCKRLQPYTHAKLVDRVINREVQPPNLALYNFVKKGG